MVKSTKCLLIFLSILFLVEIGRSSSITGASENGIKTAVFLSPMFELEPGSVVNRYYYDIDFPRGHIAVKSFDAEVVDEAGNSIPLYETYLHHWVVVNYYQNKGIKIPKYHSNVGFRKSDYIIKGNDGPCESELSQIFGLGSETRKTSTHVPDPYGIEFGNPAEIPNGYEEKWLLNVHAIDTRGAENMLGCAECRCDLYNVTVDEYGRNLDPNYIGGLRCCYDQTRCRLKEGFQSVKRSLFLKYTVKYVDWHCSIVPVRIYIFDVTDRWKKSDGINSTHICQVEYNVPAGVTGDGGINTKSVSIILPTGGNVVYGVAHQHTGGIGSTLYGEDGRVICSSLPMYGEGNEPGNEAGYIVGMSTCHPQPGSVTISDGETLTVVSNYSSGQGHTGVMGLFYILVADSDSSTKLNSSQHAPLGIHRKMLTANFIGVMVLLGVAVLAAVIGAHLRRNQRGHNYEPIMT
ncbi:hypothetical protein ACH5RR_024767 [Cinchona calisaya]|uniref:Stress up-regulated Nod 19 n=1 Tax=Cinchona calisaya TaxID=153742 RepID=A0ABD2Z177_9GENT